MPPGVDSIELYEHAVKRGISFAPGPLFSASGEFNNFIRLNCAVPWSDVTERALHVLGSLVAGFRPRTSA